MSILGETRRRSTGAQSEELFLIILLTILSATAGAKRGLQTTAVAEDLTPVDVAIIADPGASADHVLLVVVHAAPSIELRIGPAVATVEGACDAGLHRRVEAAAARLIGSGLAVRAVVEAEATADYCRWQHAAIALDALAAAGSLSDGVVHRLRYEAEVPVK